MGYMLSWYQWGTAPLAWPELFMPKDLDNFLFVFLQKYEALELLLQQTFL